MLYMYLYFSDAPRTWLQIHKINRTSVPAQFKLISVRFFSVYSYIRGDFDNYVQKTLSNCCVQLCAPWWMASETETRSSWCAEILWLW